MTFILQIDNHDNIYNNIRDYSRSLPVGEWRMWTGLVKSLIPSDADVHCEVGDWTRIEFATEEDMNWFLLKWS
jgi:hypothetical protein